MVDPVNTAALVKSQPDIIGFIFYPYSKRYVGKTPGKSLFRYIPTSILKAGVFVNEEADVVNKITEDYGLDIVQLHGNESVTYCNSLKNNGLLIIKAFEISDHFDFTELEKYSEACEYFLFDTKTGSGGGSGTKFDWTKLHEYNLDKPFFLSGGIGPGDAQSLRQLRHKQLAGIDINSGFEITPGFKDCELISVFITEVKNSKNEL